MSNMSYCRFENTLRDLRDCAENLHDEVSAEEARARRKLIEVAYDMLESNGLLTDDGKLDTHQISELPVENLDDE